MFADARPWAEGIGVLALSGAGVVLGRVFSKLPGRWWLAGYCIPLGIIILYGLGMHVPRLAPVAPFSWLLAGRIKFAIIGCLAALVLVTPLSRIERRPARMLILGLLGLVVWQMSVWPFLAPAFNRRHLASLETQVDRDGVCRQSNTYNCGPAAAVTALRCLGFAAEEGEIAILAHTSPAIGTPPDLLAAALNRRYGSDGLLAEPHVFDDMTDLGEAVPTLLIIKFSFMLDHYVAVLEVSDTDVVIGDPLNGLTRWSHAELEARWRHHGVALRRVER